MSEHVYTETITESVVARYVNAVESGANYDERTQLVAEIARELGVEATSVRGKLVAEKVYVSKEATKGKRAVRTKEAVVEALEAVTGIDELGSFTKARKDELEALFNFIVTASDQFNADHGLALPGDEVAK